MKRNTFAALLSLGVLLNSPPACALEFLDDMIYSVKCAGDANVEACKAKAKKEYEDYARRKQNGEIPSANNMGGERNGWRKEREQCFTVSASGPANVDSSYANVMEKFGFMTQEEATAWLKARRDRIKDDGYKHRTVPGQLYDMRDTVSYTTPDGRQIAFFAGAKLKRTKSGGSHIDADYCLVGDDISYSSTVNAAFKKAVQ